MKLDDFCTDLGIIPATAQQDRLDLGTVLLVERRLFRVPKLHIVGRIDVLAADCPAQPGQVHNPRDWANAIIKDRRAAANWFAASEKMVLNAGDSATSTLLTWIWPEDEPGAALSAENTPSHTMVYAGSVLKSSSWSGAMELVAQFIKGKLKLDNFKKEDVKHIRTHRLSEEFCRHLVNNWKLNLQDPKLTMLQTELKVDHRKMELCVVESVTLASIVDTEQTLSVTTGLGPSIPGAPSADVDLQHSTKDSHTGSGIQIGFNMFGLAVDTIDVGGRTASIKLKYIPPKGEVWGADVPPDELISTPSYGAQKYISSLLQGAPDNAAVSDLEINDEVEDGTSDSVACTPGSLKHCADGDASPGQQHHKCPRPSE